MGPDWIQKYYCSSVIAELVTRIISYILLFVGVVRLDRHFILPWLIIQVQQLPGVKISSRWGGGGAQWSVLPQKTKQGKMLEKYQENCKINF